MKSPLRYQATEYDCGPTSMTNAIIYMFERNEIPPDLIRHIGQGTLDSFDENGYAGRYGTSGAAIRYFGSWLNELRDTRACCRSRAGSRKKKRFILEPEAALRRRSAMAAQLFSMSF